MTKNFQSAFESYLGGFVDQSIVEDLVPELPQVIQYTPAIRAARSCRSKNLKSLPISRSSRYRLFGRHCRQLSRNLTRHSSRRREMRLVHFPGGRWKKKFPLAVVKVEDRPKVIVNAESTQSKTRTEERNIETKTIITRASAIKNKPHQSLSAANSTFLSTSTSQLTSDGKKPGRASSSAPDHLFSDELRRGVSPHVGCSNSVISYDESFAVKNNKRGGGSRGGAQDTSTRDLKSTAPQRPKRNICMKKLDTSLGLSWREENELKKALYASLQNKRQCASKQPSSDSETTLDTFGGGSGGNTSSGGSVIESGDKTPVEIGNSLTASSSSQDLATPCNGHSNSSRQSSSGSWRAQRKFASNDGFCVTPEVKKKSTYAPRKLFAERKLKTEDFITFLCFRGTKMLPPDLHFFNSPDSSCLSSFPNTPCDSVDGSQSSTASLVDEAASVSLPTTANADKHSVSAKRQISPLRPLKLAKPAKVSTRSTRLAKVPERLFITKMSPLTRAVSQAKSLNQCRTSARLRAMERRTVSRFLFLRRQAGLALTYSNGGSSTEPKSTHGSNGCETEFGTSALRERRLLGRKNSVSVLQLAKKPGESSVESGAVIRSISHRSVKVHRTKRSSEAYKLEEITRKFLCKRSLSSTPKYDLPSGVEESVENSMASMILCKVESTETNRSQAASQAASDCSSLVKNAEDSVAHVVTNLWDQPHHQQVNSWDATPNVPVSSKAPVPSLPVIPVVLSPDPPVTVLMSMCSPTFNDSSCEVLHGTVSPTPGSSVFMSSSYVVSSGYFIQHCIGGGHIQCPSATYVQQRSPEVAFLDSIRMPFPSYVSQVFCDNQSTQPDCGQPAITICSQATPIHDSELKFISQPGAGLNGVSNGKIGNDGSTRTSPATSLSRQCDEESVTSKRKRKLIFLSDVKPRRTRRQSAPSESKSSREEDGKGQSNLDNTVSKKFTVSPFQVGNKAGIRLSIKKTLLARSTETARESMHRKQQSEARLKKYTFWNRSSLKARDENISNQQKEMKGRSRPSTRSQTVAIEHQELATARMKSDKDEPVHSAASAVAAHPNSDIQGSKSCRRSVQLPRSVKLKSNDEVFQRYLRKQETGVSVCKDDNEFVKKTFLQVPSCAASLTRSQAQTRLTLHPSTEQFQDPIEYISSVNDTVGDDGICCVVPPPEGWKVECHLSERLTIVTESQCVGLLQRRRDQTVTFRQNPVFTSQSRSLADFSKRASATMAAFFTVSSPSPEQVEKKYWQLVEQGQGRVTVESAHVDTRLCGSVFPSASNTPYAKHEWNFNVLQRNENSLLTKLGPINRVNIPVLHVRMLFSTSCWTCDQHALPSIYYSHTGADVIWYCVPASQEAHLKRAISSVTPIPDNMTLSEWLASNLIMISPDKLRQFGVTVHRIVQKAGQFIILFPQSFVASVACGYNVSESIKFATADWLQFGCKAAQLLKKSKCAEFFSMDQLLLSMASTDNIHHLAVPLIRLLIDDEIALRSRMRSFGVKCSGTLPNIQRSVRRNRTSFTQSGNVEMRRCHCCRSLCYLSMVLDEKENTAFCLLHAAENLQCGRASASDYTTLVRISENELKSIADVKLTANNTLKNIVVRK